jgi:hypothetical protein
MSVHWRGLCYKVKNVECRVPTVTKWNKKQPMLILKGQASNVVFEDDRAIIT